jgi:hypothetical protein
MNRRIVCWLTNDPCSLVAAKLAIRENDALANPLPLAVVNEGGNVKGEHLEACAAWLGVPVVQANACKAELYRLAGDVHVIGVPREEQGRYDEFMAAHEGVPVLAVLADRGLSRDDCIELVTRAGIKLPCGGKGVLLDFMKGVGVAA